MPLTPQQVSEKTFTSTRFKPGYDEAEVDAFLDEVEAELNRLTDEVSTLRRQLDSAQLAHSTAVPVPVAAEPAPVPVPVESAPAPEVVTPRQTEMEEMLRRTLLLAQRTADEVVAEARTEADQKLAEARLQAESMRVDSERRAADTDRAAALRQSAMLAEFESNRRRLEEEIAALRGYESEFRGRLRAYLELQLRDLEAAALDPGMPVPGPSGSSAPVASSPVPPPADAPATGFVIDVPPGQPEPVGMPELPPLPSWMNTDTDRAAEAAPEPLSGGHDHGVETAP